MEEVRCSPEWNFTLSDFCLDPSNAFSNEPKLVYVYLGGKPIF